MQVYNVGFVFRDANLLNLGRIPVMITGNFNRQNFMYLYSIDLSSLPGNATEQTPSKIIENQYDFKVYANQDNGNIRQLRLRVENLSQVGGHISILVMTRKGAIAYEIVDNIQ